jgi:DNA-binding GntR family transcriptional regulator
VNSKERIIRELRTAIVRGEYKPGEHLIEMALCGRFKVSRTPVREALNQLEKEGLVKITPAVGARVVTLSPDEIMEIYDLLIVLEGASSRLACPHITEEQIDKLEEYNTLFENAMPKRNAALLFQLNVQFHWLITEATRNSVLIDLRMNFRRLVDRISRIFPDIPGQCEATLSEHRQIIEALRSRNPALAEFIMREHLEGAKRHLYDYLRERQGEGEMCAGSARGKSLTRLESS